MNNKSIGIDGRGAILYRGTGIGTYTWQLIAHLKNEIKNLHTFLPGQEYLDFTFSSKDAPENKDIWREEFLPKMIREKDIERYHVPQNGIGLPDRKYCEESVTIHDLIPYIYPETVGKGYLKEFLREMPHIMDRADMVITVSECSANDIQKIFRYPKERIHIIHEAPEPIYRPIEKKTAAAFLKDKYDINDDYILYVGGYGIRKNVKTLINAFFLFKKEEESSLRLVLPGRRNRESDSLEQLIEALGMQDDIIFTGYVPVSEMPYFYNGATLMVYPSIYEGFGLPPLEAMACGTPVISARTSSMPEILGDSALWFDPFRATDLAEQIHRFVKSDSLRKHYTKQGLKKAQSYSWESNAKETAKLLFAPVK